MNSKPKLKPMFDIVITDEQKHLLHTYMNGDITLRELTRLWGDKYPQKTLNHVHNILIALYQRGDLVFK